MIVIVVDDEEEEETLGFMKESITAKEETSMCHYRFEDRERDGGEKRRKGSFESHKKVEEEILSLVAREMD